MMYRRLGFVHWLHTATLLFAIPTWISTAFAELHANPEILARRDNSPGSISQTNACERYAQASALVNGTVYLYGGNVRHKESETNHTVSRYFLTLDLTKLFPIDDPPLKGLPIPPANGPPKVSYGIFWPNNDELIFYGGLTEQFPRDANIPPLKIWSYDISRSVWSPIDTTGSIIQRAAEGTATTYKGVGYYRGGHIDSYTEQSWPDSRDRQYLTGMLEYDLETNKINNITTGFDAFPAEIQQGYQDSALVPITLNGRDYLINFGGGRGKGGEPDMGDVWIYDIADKEWYKQPTAGAQPRARRSACTVHAYAKDGSSVNIFLYGGKHLNPDGETSFEAFGEMWVLSIPSFTWIQVSKDASTNTPNRDSHQCHLVGRNLVVIGGRLDGGGPLAECDQSTIYNYDVVDLEWKTTFDPSKHDYLVAEAISNAIGGGENGSAPWDNVPAMQPPDVNNPIVKYVRGKRQTSADGTTSISIPETSTKKRIHAAIISGAVIGGIAVLALILVIAFCVYRRRKRRETHVLPYAPPTRTRTNPITPGGIESVGFPSPGSPPFNGSKSFYSANSPYSTQSGYTAGNPSPWSNKGRPPSELSGSIVHTGNSSWATPTLTPMTQTGSFFSGQGAVEVQGDNACLGFHVADSNPNSHGNIQDGPAELA